MKIYQVLIKRPNYYTSFNCVAENDAEAISLAQNNGDVVYDCNGDVILTSTEISNDDIDYNEQMLSYYPKVIQSIREFRQLIETQSFEVDEMRNKLDLILNNAFIETAEEDRIAMWEKYLGIAPSPQKEDEEYEDWLTSRRNIILAKMYPSQKLNTKAIKDIVYIFTGCVAESWLLDGVLYVKIYSSSNGKTLDLDDIIAELKRKAPAHLSLVVYRTYSSWNGINSEFSTWKDVYNECNTWKHVLEYGNDSSPDIFEYLVDESGNSIVDESSDRLFN